MYCPAAHTTPKKRAKNSVFYRFNFNGQERDDEVYGAGNAYSFEYRVHDPRLGRFLSVDPLFKDYPWYTPYQFAGNQPIWAIDLEGKEEFIVTHYVNTVGQLYKTVITVVRSDVPPAAPTNFGIGGVAATGGGNGDNLIVHTSVVNFVPNPVTGINDAVVTYLGSSDNRLNPPNPRQVNPFVDPANQPDPNLLNRALGLINGNVDAVTNLNTGVTEDISLVNNNGNGEFVRFYTFGLGGPQARNPVNLGGTIELNWTGVQQDNPANTVFVPNYVNAIPNQPLPNLNTNSSAGQTLNPPNGGTTSTTSMGGNGTVIQSNTVGRDPSTGQPGTGTIIIR